MKLPHRSWLVALGSSLALFTVMGLGVNVFSAYQPTIVVENGFTNTQGSLITTVRTLFSIFTMLMTGRIVDKIGLRATTGLGMICSVLSCIVFGLADSFPLYCFGGILAGIAYALAGMIPLSIAISRWFHIRRGFALGISSAGSGVATIFAPPLIAHSIEMSGLPQTFYTEAIITVALTIIVVALVRNYPQDVGLVPYGDQQSEDTHAVTIKTTSVSPTVWCGVLFVGVLTGAPSATAYAHLTMLYSTEGFAPETITLLLSYSGFALMIGKIVYGQIRDSLGTYRSNYILFGIAIAGMSLCCLAPNGNLVVAFLAATGTAIGLSLSVALPLWAFDFSSTQQCESRARWATISFMVGNLIFSPIPGIIADATGSYVPAFALFGVVSVVGLVVIQIIYLKYGKSMSLAN